MAAGNIGQHPKDPLTSVREKETSEKGNSSESKPSTPEPSPMYQVSPNEQRLAELTQLAHITLRVSAGCGSRAEDFINKAFDKLNAHREKMGLGKVTVPTASDDGTGGPATGTANLLRNGYYNTSVR